MNDSDRLADDSGGRPRGSDEGSRAPMRRLSMVDRALSGAQVAAGRFMASRTGQERSAGVFNQTPGAPRPYAQQEESRASPVHEAVSDHTIARPAPDGLDEPARRHSAGLMRVNHVGEVCAQALYEGQAVTARSVALARFFRQSAAEERAHLAWTEERLAELRSSPSLLRPAWYAGSFALGVVAGLAGDRQSLGFMMETERQVERHLESHLSALPAEDLRSREIVARMKADEARHADEAGNLGAASLPEGMRMAMRFLAKVMTTTAYRI